MPEKQTDNTELLHIITHFTFTPQVNSERNQSLVDDVCINQQLDVINDSDVVVQSDVII
jgi:hypothetical protein